MNDPSNSLGWAVWQRGARLGLVWLGVFLVMTAAAYGLLALAGWDGVLAALCALGLGPVLALIVIAGWWLVRRPTLAPPAPTETTQADDSVLDDTSG